MDYSFLTFIVILAYAALSPVIYRIVKNRMEREISEKVLILKNALLEHPEEFLKQFQPVIDQLISHTVETGSKSIQGQIPMIKLPIIGKVPISVLEPFIRAYAPKLLKIPSAEVVDDNPFLK